MNNRFFRLIFLLILLGMMPCQTIIPIPPVKRTPDPRSANKTHSSDDETSQDEDEEEDDDDSLLLQLAAGGAAAAAVGAIAYITQKAFTKKEHKQPKVVVPGEERGESQGNGFPDSKYEDIFKPSPSKRTENEQPGDATSQETLEQTQLDEKKRQTLSQPSGADNEDQERKNIDKQGLQPEAAEQRKGDDYDDGGEPGAADEDRPGEPDNLKDGGVVKSLDSSDDETGDSELQSLGTPKPLFPDKKNSDNVRTHERFNYKELPDLQWNELSENQRIVVEYLKEKVPQVIAIKIANFVSPEQKEKERDVKKFTAAVTGCGGIGLHDFASQEGLKQVKAAWKAHSNLLHDVVFHYFWETEGFQNRIKDIFTALARQACKNKIIDARDEKEQTALFLVCSKSCADLEQKTKIVKLLIENKASVNSRNSPVDKKLCEQRPLQAALSHVVDGAAKSELGIVQMLIENRANISLFCCSDNDPIIKHKKAIMNYSFPETIFATLDVHGNSPLCRMIASEYYSFQEIVQILEKYKPDVNFPYDAINGTLLCKAPVRHNNAKIHCVNKASSPYKQSDKICYRSPLQCAITRGDQKLIAKLVELKANILYCCCKDHDPMVCTKKDNKEEKSSVECLVKCFCESPRYFKKDPLANNDKTTTFLHRMMSNTVPIPSIKKFLECNLVDINCPGRVKGQDKCQWTPLQAALLAYMSLLPDQVEYYQDYINLLIDHKADIHRTCCEEHNLISLIRRGKEGLSLNVQHEFLQTTLVKVQKKYDEQHAFFGLSLAIPAQFVGDSKVVEITIADPLLLRQKYERVAFSRFATKNRGSMWTKMVQSDDGSKQYLLDYYSPISYSDGEHRVLQLYKIDSFAYAQRIMAIDKSNEST